VRLEERQGGGPLEKCTGLGIDRLPYKIVRRGVADVKPDGRVKQDQLNKVRPAYRTRVFDGLRECLRRRDEKKQGCKPEPRHQRSPFPLLPALEGVLKLLVEFPGIARCEAEIPALERRI